jgi:hypothetical protein
MEFRGDVVALIPNPSQPDGVFVAHKWREEIRMRVEGYHVEIAGSWRSLCGAGMRRGEVRTELRSDVPAPSRVIDRDVRISQQHADRHTFGGRNQIDLRRMSEGRNYRVRIRFEYQTLGRGKWKAPLVTSPRIRCGETFCEIDERGGGKGSVGGPRAQAFG